MLELREIKKNYPGFALDCSLALPAGRITGLIGPNGAGKTTLYKIALGLAAPDSGTARLFGKDTAKIGSADRRKLGVMFAESGFSGYLCSGDICRIMEAFYPDFDGTAFLRECRESGIPEKKTIREFSTGMKAKLKLLTVLKLVLRLLASKLIELESAREKTRFLIL